jgi:hypothetical protein
MSEITFITSLYRSESHLPSFLQHLVDLRGELGAHGIDASFLLIANDATPDEHELIDPLANDGILEVEYVARESLYASWHRGIQRANTDLLGFWNVDDIRYAPAIEEALDRFAQGYELVDTPLDVYDDDELVETRPAPYNPQYVSPKHVVSTFFMFTRALYERAGEFDPHFRIVGDLEWCTRDVVRQSRHTSTEATGGAFVMHGENLSQNTSEREWVEINIVLLWRGAYEHLRPVDPKLMREMWATWGKDADITLPPAISAWLWGDDDFDLQVEAEERYEAYSAWRSSHPLWQKARLWGAYRLGLAHPEEEFHPPALTDQTTDDTP